MLNFYMPVRLYGGKSCFEKHREEIASFGKSCLLVTGASSAKKSGAFEEVTGILNSLDIAWSLYDGVRENPTVASCMEAGKIAAEKNVSFILGIGGGSPLDAAKAVSVFAANPSLDETAFYKKEWDNNPLPILLVGTTAGTGSEVTDVSVLTDSKKKKHSIHDPRMYAKLSFCDPAYTMSLPLPVTLSTGIDVLAHAAESYFSKKANEISRAFSVRSISLLYRPLEKAASGEELSFDEREALFEAAILGGLAICVTGTCFPHNVGYYLTETYHVPHGIACATFLEDFLKHVKTVDAKYSEEFYDRIRIDENSLTELIRKVLPQSDIRMTPEKIKKALPRWENNGSVNNTLGTVHLEDIQAYLSEKFVY